MIPVVIVILYCLAFVTIYAICVFIWTKVKGNKQKTYYGLGNEERNKDLLAKGFVTSHSVSDVLYIDSRVGLWCAVSPTKPYSCQTILIFSFAGIVSVDFLLNGKPIVTLNNLVKETKAIENLSVHVKLNNEQQSVLDISFIDTKVKPNDAVCIKAIETANSVAEALRDISSSVGKEGFMLSGPDLTRH